MFEKKELVVRDLAIFCMISAFIKKMIVLPSYLSNLMWPYEEQQGKFVKFHGLLLFFLRAMHVNK